MKYEIFSKCVPDNEEGFGVIGFEIKPPLSDLAAQGLCRELMTKTESEPYATSVNVTRNDVDGTALIYRQAQPEGRDFYPPSAVATMIGKFIDPCNLHFTPGINLDQ